MFIDKKTRKQLHEFFQIPQNNIPATLYGLFRRATEWHGAKLTLVPLESHDSQGPVNSFDDVTLDVCSLEALSAKLSEDRFAFGDD